MARRRTTQLATKKSPSSWLGDFIPLSADEAVLWGPAFRADLQIYADHIIHSLAGFCESQVRAELLEGHVSKISVSGKHSFWRRKLIFEFPPLPANEIIKRIHQAITTAMQTPNVDPVILARESLSHGPSART